MIEWVRSLGPDAVVWLIVLATIGALYVLGFVIALIEYARAVRAARRTIAAPQRGPISGLRVLIGGRGRKR